MRKVLLLLVMAGLLLWATTTLAFWRPIIRHYYGDPDEFESAGSQDKARRCMVSARPIDVGGPDVGKRSSGRRLAEWGRKRCFSVDFSGRKLFLER